MRIVTWAWLVLLAWPAPAMAQTQAQLDKATRFGAIAAIGPICGLRDGQWAADLRQAEMQAMGARPRPGPGDPGRLADRAGAALSYAEDEALENFAADPSSACARLARAPDLAQADGMVAAFRAGTGVPVW